jgi:ectoine hydroxylase-related dioxygenase (phytanoyl-CoA dioxygenase family)
MTAFTDRERREFARNGFLTRDDLLSEDLLADAREAIHAGTDVDLDDPDEVVGAGYDVDADGVDQDPFTEVAETIFPAAEALVGEGVLATPGEGMQVALNFPDEDSGNEFLDPQSVTGHLDGYADFDENPEVYTFTVGAAVYVNDVRPRSGGFTVWPGSHRVAARYFEDHALETVGGKPDNSQVPAVGDEAGEWDYDDLLWNQYDPDEISGEAGTVVFWHSKLTHNAGINVGEDVRMAAITRFAREDQREVERDDAKRLFAYWPAMDGVPMVAGGDPVVSGE